MKLDFNGLLYALSYALDCEEAEILGVSESHAKWVAYISSLMGQVYDFSYEKLSDLAACSILHDNALTQYIAEEKRPINSSNIQMGAHCIIGEQNVTHFPFYTDMKEVILCHHENADGSGPFKRLPEETPVCAQIIHLADYMDTACRFKDISNEKYSRILFVLEQQKDILFSKEMVMLFRNALPREKYLSLKGKSIDSLLRTVVPPMQREIDYSQMRDILDIFAKIVDYKSSFTRNHSVEIAEKVYQMGKFYGYPAEINERLYIAGALHDIGKMAIDNDVLEKPDKLTDQEYIYMQNHAWYTYEILSQMKGFEDITLWASLHHEKLNGKGYPFGKNAAELDEKERLMACVDIYQALSEPRPYKPGMPHATCIKIMTDMADGGFIDSKIVSDINRLFGNSSDSARAGSGTP